MTLEEQNKQAKLLMDEAIKLLTIQQGFVTLGDVFMIQEAVASTMLSRGDAGTHAVQ